MSSARPLEPRCLLLVLVHSKFGDLVGILVLAEVLVLVLVQSRQQSGDVADAFGHTLSEKQLGPDAQVLGVFEEMEADHGALPSSQLLLQDQHNCKDLAPVEVLA